MIAVFIAAGLGSRLAPLTNECPKCMLPLGGVPILRRNIDLLRQQGVAEVFVITGYRKECIDFDDVQLIENMDFRNNNILFSLMSAKAVFERAINEQVPLVVSYSDIVYESAVLETLMATPGDFVLTVDQGWRDAYIGRTDHPEDEAEIAVLNQGYIARLGKGVTADPHGGSERECEFIGLLKLTPKACEQWLGYFAHLEGEYAPTAPFMGAPEFRKSYLTHFLQYLANTGVPLTPAMINGGWREFDTVQDYLNLASVFDCYTVQKQSDG